MPQTLLLADDSATIQRVIELTFAGEDIKVIAVSDGDQAIARIQSAPPDIVLADVGMPGKTGYEVAEYVKRTPQLAHIPVVLLTGAFEPVDQARAAAAGCDGVLAKPFEPQIVIGRVRELLGKGGAAPAPAAPAAPASNVFEFAPAAATGNEAASAQQAAELQFGSSHAASAESKVEDYFDRLDAAFATFSSGPAPAKEPELAPAPAPVAAVPDELDWLRPKQSQQAAAVPPPDFAIADELVVEPTSLVEELPAPVAIAPAPIPEPEPEPVPVAPPPPPVPVFAMPEPAREPLPPEPRAPFEPHEPRGLPSLPEAFSAILAAEQNALGVRPEWPAPASLPGQPHASAAAPAEIVITDELVERVARRVLEQMSDRAVRETVAQIASDVAERLVREEIERIKAAAK